MKSSVNTPYSLDKYVSIFKRECTSSDSAVIASLSDNVIRFPFEELSKDSNLIKFISTSLVNASRQEESIQEQSREFSEELVINELNLNNYKEILLLDDYKSLNISQSSECKSSKISFIDIYGNTVAIAEIDFQNKRLKVDFLANILPKQKCLTPSLANQRVILTAHKESWSTEDGGINQFNSNIETRYKDFSGKVIAAVIALSDGTADTVVEYEYRHGKKSKMLHTGKFGQTITIYDTTKEAIQLVNIDIDTDGNIISITKNFNNFSE